MALFLVPRYAGDGEEGEENDPGSHSLALLRRLQERAKTRELQKVQPGSTVSAKPSPPESKISEDESSSKEASGNKKRRGCDESPLRKVCKKRRKKQQEDENLAETDRGSDQEDDETDAKKREGAGHKEIEEREEQSVPALSPNTGPSLPPPPPPPPPRSLIVLGHCSRKPVQKVKPFLPPWLNQPRLLQRRIKENLVPLREVPEIHPKLVKKLQANGIESLFPVQAEVIPAILTSASGGFLTGRGGYQPSDICVSAPTGSGKTLAFVIPVVQALLDRVVCHVRALVVLPTKELAQQVSKVFNIYTDGTGLKVVQITGQKSFAKEQESLVEKTLTGVRSLADIVVATPGRLVDHLQQTTPFSLRQLRFLVIDEADRMIDGMHQNWLEQVTTAAVDRPVDGAHHPRLFDRMQQGPLTAARASVPRLPFQKLLFSATLTRNMEKLQPLGLFRPRLFAPASASREEEEAEGEAEADRPGPLKEHDKEEKEEEEKEKKYTLPEGLSHYFVPCSLRWKPLYLLHFLLRLKFSRVLCFVNSKETSHRLFLLVKAFGGVSVAEFSSQLTPGQRKWTLKEFERGKVQLLISTDATARGIDITGVKCVISYDAPQFIRTYIHRVGRTARAGRAGLAFTLLLKQQESKFLQMLREAGLPPLERQLVRSGQIRTLLPGYEEALAALQETVKEERAEKRS